MRANWMQDHAREILGMPETWQAYRYQWIDGANNSKTLLIQGAVPLALLKKGPMVGFPNWKKIDAGTVRTCCIPGADHDAWSAAREARTGECKECRGEGKKWISSSVKDGTKFKPCPKCDGTGKVERMAS